MIKTILKLPKKYLFLYLLLIVVGIYFFLAFLPMPQPIRINLDESWAYAISRAAQDKLIFGKDIIFTYGPLGYLITGATLKENFLPIIIFRWGVYTLLYIIFIFRIVTLKKLLDKIFLGASFLLAFLSGIPHVGIGMATDYQILFIILIFLSFDKPFKKYPHFFSLLLGSVSGFCLLTKFSLGIYTLGSLTLFLIGNLYSAIRRKSNSEIITYILSILNSFLAATTVALILLSPLYSTLYFSQVLQILIISGLMGTAFFFIQKRIPFRQTIEPQEQLTNSEINLANYKHLLPISAFYLTYCLLLAYLIFSSPSSYLLDYLKYSLEMSSAYSSSMSVVGHKAKLALALSICSLILLILFFLAKKGYLNLSLVLLFVLMINFKHGFIRQDGHVIVFVVLAPLIASLSMAKIKQFRYRKFGYYLQIYILIASLLITGSFFPFDTLLRRFSLNDISTKMSLISNLNILESTIHQLSLNYLAKNKLPEPVINLVAQKPIDIIPWEISLVPANNLNWKPRPLFQSYSAYTTTLDNINFESLSKEPRDYIFYNFLSIDGRHPFFDEPKAFSYVFCNYEPSSVIQNFIKTSISSKIILLEKRSSNRCSSTIEGETLSIPWKVPQSIQATNKAIIRANVKIQYSIFGKLYKAIFRAPPVIMAVDYTDGYKLQYRIVPENSENGIIVSHLPRDANEAMSFLQGQLPNPVKSFSFYAVNSLLYKPNIEISFSSQLLR